MGVVLKELRRQSAAGAFRLLVAVDGVNALWGRTTLTREDRSPVGERRRPLRVRVQVRVRSGHAGGAAVDARWVSLPGSVCGQAGGGARSHRPRKPEAGRGQQSRWVSAAWLVSGGAERSGTIEARSRARLGTARVPSSPSSWQGPAVGRGSRRTQSRVFQLLSVCCPGSKASNGFLPSFRPGCADRPGGAGTGLQPEEDGAERLGECADGALTPAAAQAGPCGHCADSGLDVSGPRAPRAESSPVLNHA